LGFARRWWRWIDALLGRRVIALLGLGLVFGLLLFVVELAFANALQFLLYSLGVTSRESLPAWAPELPLQGVLAVIFVIGATKALLQWGQAYLQNASFEESRYLQRSRLVRSAIFGSSASAGQVITLYNDRIVAFSAIVMTFSNLAVTLTALLLIGVSLFAITPWVTAMAVGSLAVIGVMLRTLDQRISHAAKGWSEAGEHANRRLLMSMKNLLLLQIYGTQARENSKAQTNLRHFRDEILKFHQILGIKSTVAQLAGLTLVSISAFFIVRSHALPAASIIAFFYLFMRFVQYLSESAKTIGVYSLNWPQFKEYVSWWESAQTTMLPSTVRNAGSDTIADRILSAPVGWRVSHAAYQYPGSSRPVFQDLQFTIDPGSMMAIIGPSGVGKSTLLNMLIGNAESTRGSVQVFNDRGCEDIADIRGNLLRTLGYVGPESFLIEGSVLENILYGLETEPDPAEIEAALQMAECSFVYEHPAQLKQQLTDQGQGLSAGQKQRLCVARALLRRPRALILDEATSNLDRETEIRLLESLSQLKGRITIIAVTHRKEILNYADEVLDLQLLGIDGSESSATELQNA
jgi:ABC-type multidrug transport system fused ATPase/permease subunit